MKTYQVSEVAQLANVTVRTLHYYEEVGLLVPSERTRAGYRLYREEDLLRLQQILIRRELGFPLKRIKAILDDPAFDYRSALLEQRDALRSKQSDLSRLVRAVDAALSALDGHSMNTEEVFGGFDPAAHEAEVEGRWGRTRAYEESAKRMKGYSPNDLETLKREQDELFERMAETMRGGEEPNSERARGIAEAHRQYIERWFYPCTRSMHAGLAEMYLSDTRFHQAFEAHETGLTEFFAAAIEANCAEP